MAIQWLRCGHHVNVVSICIESRAASIMLYHLLLQTVNTQQSAGVSRGQPHLLLYEIDGVKSLKKALRDLSRAANGGALYVIADEVAGSYRSPYFPLLCDKLLTYIPRVHLWAASCFHERAPAGWQVEYLTRPLRSPPAVVREVERDEMITRSRLAKPYRERGVPDHTDGPPVTRLYHGGQGHSDCSPVDCVTCGRKVASFLHSLRVGVTGSCTTTSRTFTPTSGGTTTPCLQWRDVLVLNWHDISDDSGMVKGLQEAGIPVRVMKDDDIEDVATAFSDVVWVGNGRCVRGLERKVVVCVEDHVYDFITSSFNTRTKMKDMVERYIHTSSRLNLMSRCTSQLMIVSTDFEISEDD
ncbi:uncharacterized protein LOC112575586 [Pomacea canaliculata]|uniref:uncharacterized protein LOC112575586 n=1 Tax=Pomacea canaliculata TaxID=400727 RepID=UPI000D7300AC|nr:uncharacterized protein LOC112575586 [Pomacea canaliculata]